MGHINNHQKKPKALKFKSPYATLLEKFDSNPELFKENPYLKLRGLNTKGVAMDFNFILNIIVVLLLVYVAFIKEYFLSYTKKKAENTASIEDAEQLTRITKGAEMPFNQEQEELKYRLAIAMEGEKFRLEKYKALYAKLDSLKTAFSSIEVHIHFAHMDKANSNFTIFNQNMIELFILIKANPIEFKIHKDEIANLEKAFNELLKAINLGQKEKEKQDEALKEVANAIDELKSSVFFRVGSLKVAV